MAPDSAGVPQRQGDWLAIAVEALEHSEAGDDRHDYRIMPTGRHSHRQDYLKRLAESNGMDVVAMEGAATRQQKDKPVMSWITLWQRRPGDARPERR